MDPLARVRLLVLLLLDLLMMLTTSIIGSPLGAFAILVGSACMGRQRLEPRHGAEARASRPVRVSAQSWYFGGSARSWRRDAMCTVATRPRWRKGRGRHCSQPEVQREHALEAFLPLTGG